MTGKLTFLHWRGIPNTDELTERIVNDPPEKTFLAAYVSGRQITGAIVDPRPVKTAEPDWEVGELIEGEATRCKLIRFAFFWREDLSTLTVMGGARDARTATEILQSRAYVPGEPLEITRDPVQVFEQFQQNTASCRLTKISGRNWMPADGLAVALNMRVRHPQAGAAALEFLDQHRSAGLMLQELQWSYRGNDGKVTVASAVDGSFSISAHEDDFPQVIDRIRNAISA